MFKQKKKVNVTTARFFSVTDDSITIVERGVLGVADRSHAQMAADRTARAQESETLKIKHEALSA